MSKSFALWALVLVLGLASIGAWLLGGDASTTGAVRAPTSDSEASARDAPLSSDPARDARARPAATTPSATASDARTRVVARAIDEHGDAIEGAELDVVAGAEPASATSAGDGRLELELVPHDATSADGAWVTLRLAHAGSVPLVVGARVPRGRVTHLGALRLALGGSIAGSVVDAGGKELAGVDVLLQTTPDGALPFPVPTEVSRQAASLLLERSGDAPCATSDAAGRFRFSGVAEGVVRVWIATPTSLASFSAPLAVRAGAEATCPPLRLDDPPAESAVEGVVLAPDGAPAAGARVVPRELVAEERAGVFSDAHGRFRIVVERDASVDLRADDPRGRWGWTEAVQVAAGTRGVRLQLAARRTIAIDVVDAAGERVEGARAVAAALDRFARIGEARAGAEGGPLALAIPAERFAVDVSAPGFVQRSLGPFEPASCPATARCELESLPTIRGRVVSASGPVAGATVEILALIAGDRVRRLERPRARPTAFESRVERVLRSTRTRADGSFVLAALDEREARLGTCTRATAPGYAPKSIHAAPSVDRALAIELDAGGSIAGRVRVEGELDLAGFVVAATSGDGLVHTTRTEPDGAYVLDRLEPGAYHVAVLDVELESFADAFSAPGGTRRERADCEVRASAVASFDLELQASETLVLDGRVQVDGWSMEGWTVRWRASADRERSQPVALAADGTFELALRDARSIDLEVRGRDPHGNPFVVQDRIALARGRNAWSQLLRTASLSGRVDEPNALWPDKRLACVGAGNGTAIVATLLEFDRFHAVERACVPAGSGRIVRMRRADEIDLGGDWPTACTYTVEPSAALELAIP